MINRRRWFVILFYLCIVHASGFARGDKLKINFPQITYVGDELFSYKRGSLDWQNINVEADQMKFNRIEKSLSLEGNVLILHPGFRLETTSLNFDLGEGKGEVGRLFGETSADDVSFVRETESAVGPGGYDQFRNNMNLKTSSLLGRQIFFSADRVEISETNGDKFDFTMYGASFTDCDQEQPCHDFRIGKLRYKDNHFGEAYHLVPRLYGIPYFYIPYVGRNLSLDWPWTRWSFGSRRQTWGNFLQFEIKPNRKNDDIKFTYGARENRGHSGELDWEMDASGFRRHLHLGTWLERSVLQNDVIFEDVRWRFDYTERRVLGRYWNLSLDLHAMDPMKQSLWRSVSEFKTSDDFFSSPFSSHQLSDQIRQNLIQDYDEAQWLRGDLLENELLLEYDRGRQHFEVGSIYPSDGQLLTGRMKMFHMRYRHLLEPFGSGWYGSADFGFGQQGQRLGWDLSDDDLATLGNIRRKEFQTWRLDGLLRAERRSYLGPVSLTPWFGSQMMAFGEWFKDKGGNASFFDFEETDIEKNNWAPRLIGGLELDSKASALFDGGRLLHQMRPSLRFNYAGPSRYHRERVIAEVDRMDRLVQPRYELIYGIRNEIVDARDADRLYYVQSLSFRQLFRSEDEQELFGEQLRDGFDTRFAQSFYPLAGSELKLFNEIRLNSHHHKNPWLLAAIEFNRGHHSFSYGFNHFELETTNLHRHDLNWRYSTRNNDYAIRVSFDGDNNSSSVLKSEDHLYEKGFRRLGVAWSHLFHCMRGEVELDYDFQNSGTRVLVRFGPDLLRGMLPSLLNKDVN